MKTLTLITLAALALIASASWCAYEVPQAISGGRWSAIVVGFLLALGPALAVRTAILRRGADHAR